MIAAVRVDSVRLNWMYCVSTDRWVCVWRRKKMKNSYMFDGQTSRTEEPQKRSNFHNHTCLRRMHACLHARTHACIRVFTHTFNISQKHTHEHPYQTSTRHKHMPKRKPIYWPGFIHSYMHILFYVRKHFTKCEFFFSYRLWNWHVTLHIFIDWNEFNFRLKATAFAPTIGTHTHARQL